MKLESVGESEAEAAAAWCMDLIWTKLLRTGIINENKEKIIISV